MKNFKEYYLNEDVELNEDVMQTIADIFGYTTTTIVITFGASLLGLGLSASVKGLVNIWRKIIANVKSLKGKNAREIAKELNQDPKVKKIINAGERQKNNFEEELGDLFAEIEKGDLKSVKEEYDKLNSTIKDLPQVRRVIVQELTKKFGPPLYYKSPGNQGYQAIKKVIDIKTARAAAYAAQKAIEDRYDRE